MQPIRNSTTYIPYTPSPHIKVNKIIEIILIAGGCALEGAAIGWSLNYFNITHVSPKIPAGIIGLTIPTVITTLETFHSRSVPRAIFLHIQERQVAKRRKLPAFSNEAVMQQDLRAFYGQWLSDSLIRKIFNDTLTKDDVSKCCEKERLAVLFMIDELYVRAPNRSRSLSPQTFQRIFQSHSSLYPLRYADFKLYGLYKEGKIAQELLEAAGWKPLDKVLFEAVKKNDFALITKMLGQGASIDVKDKKRRTPLMIAAQKGHLKVMRALKPTTSKLNKTLIWAAKKDDLKAVQTLTSCGARVQVALVRAARENDSIAVSGLIKHGGDLDKTLVWAAKKNYPVAIKRLIEQGADPNTADRDGWSPLMHAAWNNNCEAIEALHDSKANLEARDHEGWTPFIFAAFNTHLKAMETLKNRGAKIDAKDDMNWTGLHYLEAHH